MFKNLLKKVEMDGEKIKPRMAGPHNRKKKTGSNKKYAPSSQALHQIGLKIVKR